MRSGQLAAGPTLKAPSAFSEWDVAEEASMTKTGWASLPPYCSTIPLHPGVPEWVSHFEKEEHVASLAMAADCR
jgi:hypothetical protein